MREESPREHEHGLERLGRDAQRWRAVGRVALEVAQHAEQDRERRAVVEGLDVHDAKERREGGLLFAHAFEALGGALGDDGELSAGHVGLEKARHVGVARAGAPRVDHRREVVDVEDVAELDTRLRR